jgi:hypothetical protein
MVVRCAACRSGSIPPGRSSRVPRRPRSTDVSTSSLGRTAPSASRSFAATRRTWARGRPWPTTRSACSRLRPMRSPPRATRCRGSQRCAGAGDRAAATEPSVAVVLAPLVRRCRTRSRRRDPSLRTPSCAIGRPRPSPRRSPAPPSALPRSKTANSTTSPSTVRCVRSHGSVGSPARTPLRGKTLLRTSSRSAPVCRQR